MHQAADMARAKRRMVTAGVVAFISAAVALFVVAGASGMPGGDLAQSDLSLTALVAFITVGLGVGTLLGSRACAILLFGSYCLDKLALLIHLNQEGIGLGQIPGLAIWLGILCLALYFNGVVGTFVYQNLKKQSETQARMETWESLATVTRDIAHAAPYAESYVPASYATSSRGQNAEPSYINASPRRATMELAEIHK